MNIAASEKAVNARLVYWISNISDVQAQHIANTFTAIISSIIANPDGKVSCLKTISDADIAELAEWNDATMDKDNVDICIHDRIYEQVVARPSSLAVESWDGKLSFKELDLLSSRLATHLVGNGIAPEEMVLVCFDKSLWAIVSMLAILKFGGVLVPLDPKHPIERHRGIIRDTAARVILVGPGYQDRFQGSIDTSITVDEAFLKQLSLTESAPIFKVSSSQLAFIFYTSGTTGTPKGMMHEHRGFASRALAFARTMQIGPDTRVLQFAGFAFDVGIVDIFVAIMSGGCVCVPSEEERVSDLVGFVNRAKTNWAHLTPTVASLFKPSEVPSLRTLLLSGEPLSAESMRTWGDAVQLVNTYGPTECAIWTTSLFGAKSYFSPRNVGRGVALRTWIVSASNHNLLAPIGSIGELVIECPDLARGYLNNAEQTASAFIQSPDWATEDNGGLRRFYKTGDLTQFNADGTINVIGRKDTQIKLRGIRIEVGEIEQQIHKAKAELGRSVVELVSTSHQPNESLLAVFFAQNDESDSIHDHFETIDVTETMRSGLLDLEVTLKDVLPSYMIPSLYIPTTRLPLTTNGKLDRQKLRRLANGLSQEQLATFSLTAKKMIAPSTAMEVKMRTLWQQTLGLGPELIGVEDNFFRLGGDSVGAMKLVASSRTENVMLTVGDVFYHPVLRDLAIVADKMSSTTQAAEQSLGPFELWDAPEPLYERIQELAASCGLDEESVQDVYPCTPLQEGLMALSIKSPGAYVSQMMFKLPSDIDIARFKLSWQTVVEATPILRTRIVLYQNLASIQIVVEEDLNWNTGQSIQEYLRQDKKVLVKYGDPLNRHSIIEAKNDPDRYFVWTAHHAVFDGWTISLVFDQLQRAYSGTPLDTTTPFSHFIRYIRQSDPDEAVQYWRSKFATGDDTVAHFPALPSGLYQAQANSSHRLIASISPSNGTQVTVATFVQAAWAMVISSHTNSQDVVFGMTQTGRGAPIPGIQEIVGPTLTTVPVRVGLENTKPIGTMLQDIQQASAEMMPFEHMGIRSIQKLSPACEAACSFQNLLVIQPALGDDEDNQVLGLEKTEGAGSGFHAYALVVICSIDKETVHVNAQYDNRVLSKQQVEQVLRQFSYIINQLTIKDPNHIIGSVEIVDPDERREIMRRNAHLPKAWEACVHEVVSQKAMETPSAIAISAWDGDMTYLELDKISSSWACHLVGLGVGPESMIPVCFGKTRWSVIAILAILKAGGACVALNPAHPKSRLAIIVQEIHAKVAVVGPEHRELLHGLVPDIVSIGTNSTAHLLPSEAFKTKDPATHDNSAFVVFTSGSTRQPKGIVLEHKALCSSIREHGQFMRFGSTSRVLQFAAYTFDVSIAEIFTTLVYGGCICIPSDHDRMNDLAGTINRMKVNWAYLTPSVANLLRPELVPGLEILALGGEFVPQSLVSIWAHHVYLINIYGPAETAIWSTGLGGLSSDSNSADIGHGIGSVSWVTDVNDFNKLVPMGSIGELLIEGPILARGYLNDETRTAQSFVEKPNWLPKDVLPYPRRFYRTGDLVRSNTDGSITFVGRKDSQIKLHGQRVEMGEIELHVQKYFAAAENIAVEILRDPVSANKQTLALFFTPGSEIKLLDGHMDEIVVSVAEEQLPVLHTDLQELRTKLEEVLPAYMVPALFITLRTMPLNSSGKLDRVQLRRIGSELSEAQLRQYSLAATTKQPPSTNTELMLQDLWSKILGISIDSIGLRDSFFRLGGDSVEAMRLVALSQTHGISISVADIFKQPRLDKMAHSIDNTSANNVVDMELAPFCMIESRDPLPSVLAAIAEQCQIRLDLIEDAYPCTPLQEGLFALSTQQKGAYIAQRVFEIPSSMNLDTFKDTWQQVVDLNPVLRTRVVYTPATGSLQVVIHDNIEWETATELQYYLNSGRNADMPYGSPLARYGLVSASNATYFVWTAHHAIYDGWSVGMIFEQLEGLYNNSKIRELAPFKRFIHYLQNIDHASERKFWLSELAGSVPRSFPQLQSGSYVDEQRQSKTQSHSISLRQSSTSNITISSILRATWAIVVATYQDTDDVVFGMPLSGRNAPVSDIAAISGPTITTVPVRIRIDGKESVREYLQRVQTQAVDMIAFEHTGLQNIRRIVAPTEFDIMNLLVVQPVADADGHQGSLGLRELATELSEFGSYPLTLTCNLQDGAVTLTAIFKEEFIRASRVNIMLHHFEQVASQLAEESSQMTVSDICLFHKKDEDIIIGWNSSLPRMQSVDDCIHNYFNAHVIERSNEQAVCAWDGNLTYGELDEQSARLASYLISQGVDREGIVPFCFEKSCWAIVAMLAIMKAGAASVCLLPTHPVNRWKTIIQDTQPKVVLASSQQLSSLIPLHDNVFAVESSSVANLTHSTEQLPTVSPANSAFLVYTSGTTGTPKAIVVEHKAFSTSALAFGTKWNIGPGARVFQFAAFSFDASIMDIFGALILGGCICVPSEQERLDNLAGAITRSNATWIALTPSVATLLSPRSVPTLDTLVLAGEPCTSMIIERWAAAVNLINDYGVAECSVNSCYAQGLTATSDPATIGQGFAGRLWIVDKDNHNRLSPIGCIGELVVQGDTLARGYLHDIQKTMAAFVEPESWLHMCDGTQSTRIYKTGDLVCYNDDGTIQYIGRKDQQIKLHGQRIELGEIEHNIQSQDQVELSMVAYPRAGPAQKQLIALISLKGLSASSSTITNPELINYKHDRNVRLQISSIRDQLEAKIPGYMVPAIWVLTPSFPLSASGKLDRGKVTKWVEEMREGTYHEILDMEFQERQHGPLTDLDLQLQAILGAVLNIEISEVDPTRSFIRLGGDSITAMQVASRCRADGVLVHVRDVLRAGNLSELAEKATVLRQSTGREEESLGTLFPLSPIQQFYFYNLPVGQETNKAAKFHFYQSVLLRLTRYVAPDGVREALKAIVSRHSMLRSRFVRDPAGVWQQLIDHDTKESIFQTCNVEDRQAVPAILEACQNGIDIEQGSVFRAVLVNMSDGNQLIFMAAHHLVIDLVSWRIIGRDIEAYLEDGHLSIFKPLPFQSWVQLQKNQAEQNWEYEVTLPMDVPEANFEYWGMAGAPNLQLHEVVESCTLDAVHSAMLFGDSNTALRTEPLDMILAALIFSFRQTFNRSTPAIYNEGHGREPWDESLDVSETVGWFTTMTPISAPKSEDILQILRHVKDARRSIPQNGLPYFSTRFLTENGRESFSHHSPMEILFNYTGRYQQLERAKALLKLESHDDISTPAQIGENIHRQSLFEISASFRDNVARFSFIYNRNMQHQQEIREWPKALNLALTELTERSLSLEPEKTLSDFPLLATSYDGLRELMEVQLPRIHKLSLDQLEDVYACSPMQQGMLLSQIKDSRTYRVAFICEIIPLQPQPVSVEQLEDAWQQVVNRHAVLRTVFSTASGNGVFTQLVLKQFNISSTRLRCNDGDAYSMLRQRQPLEYTATRPPHNLTICQTSDGKVYIMLEISHALIDGTSTMILMKDLISAYAHTLAPTPGPLYSDYIAFLQRQSTEKRIGQWKKYLDGIEACHLPQLPDTQASRQHKRAKVNVSDIPKIYEFCAEHGVTVSNVIQTAWALVLRNYCGSDDVCFGYLSSGRDINIADASNSVGLFVNMLVSRMDMRRANTVLEIVQQVQSDFIRNLQNQHCSLAEIQHALNLFGQQLFNTCISFQREEPENSSDGNQSIHVRRIGGDDPAEVSTLSLPVFVSNFRLS